MCVCDLNCLVHNNIFICYILFPRSRARQGQPSRARGQPANQPGCWPAHQPRAWRPAIFLIRLIVLMWVILLFYIYVYFVLIWIRFLFMFLIPLIWFRIGLNQQSLKGLTATRSVLSRALGDGGHTLSGILPAKQSSRRCWQGRRAREMTSTPGGMTWSGLNRGLTPGCQLDCFGRKLSLPSNGAFLPTSLQERRGRASVCGWRGFLTLPNAQGARYHAKQRRTYGSHVLITSNSGTTLTLLCRKRRPGACCSLPREAVQWPSKTSCIRILIGGGSIWARPPQRMLMPLRHRRGYSS